MNITIDCTRRTVKEGLLDILEQYVSELNYMPPSSIRELIIGCLEMGIEIADGRELSGLKKNLKYAQDLPEEQILSFYIETVLSYNKLSRLIGFGFCSKFGDKLYGNPERESYLKKGGRR